MVTVILSANLVMIGGGYFLSRTSWIEQLPTGYYELSYIKPDGVWTDQRLGWEHPLRMHVSFQIKDGVTVHEQAPDKILLTRADLRPHVLVLLASDKTKRFVLVVHEAWARGLDIPPAQLE